MEVWRSQGSSRRTSLCGLAGPCHIYVYILWLVYAVGLCQGIFYTDSKNNDYPILGRRSGPRSVLSDVSTAESEQLLGWGPPLEYPDRTDSLTDPYGQGYRQLGRTYTDGFSRWLAEKSLPRSDSSK